MKTNILIIGLPGSGKSSLAKDYVNYELYDDFLFTIYNGKLQTAIQASKLVCMTEPRLVAPELFKKYTDRLGLTPENTLLITFENDPEQCIKNNVGRGRNVEDMIRQYSKIYNLDTFEGWDMIVKPVYK